MFELHLNLFQVGSGALFNTYLRIEVTIAPQGCIIRFHPCLKFQGKPLNYLRPFWSQVLFGTSYNQSGKNWPLYATEFSAIRINCFGGIGCPSLFWGLKQSDVYNIVTKEKTCEIGFAVTLIEPARMQICCFIAYANLALIE